MLEAQHPVPQVEVNEVATEGVAGREPATQGVLILTQHKHTVGWHRVTHAESPSLCTLPPIVEQRPVPAALLPRGAHVVPAAVRMEDSVLRGLQRRAAEARWPQQAWPGRREWPPRLLSHTTEHARKASRERRQRGQDRGQPYGPVSSPLVEDQRSRGVLSCGDRQQSLSFPICHRACHSLAQPWSL